LLDELAKGFGVTPNQLDKIFGGQWWLLELMKMEL
jgi:hypothetical protein